LVWRNSFLVLDFGLDVFNGVWGFYLQSDGFASQGFYEDLHTSAESKNQVERRFFLNIVVGQGPSIFKLFSSKNQTLLVWRNSFLVLDFGLDVFNGVWGFYLQSDGFASQGFYEDLHTSAESKNQVKRRFFLNIVVRQGPPVFELLSGED